MISELFRVRRLKSDRTPDTEKSPEYRDKPAIQAIFDLVRVTGLEVCNRCKPAIYRHKWEVPCDFWLICHTVKILDRFAIVF